MGSKDDKIESCQSFTTTSVTAQCAGIAADIHPDDSLPFLEPPVFTNLGSEPECGVEIPDNKRIARLFIGFGGIAASTMFVMAGFERASSVFIPSITLLSVFAGAGFVYLFVKAILAAEYDFEL